MAYYRTLRHAMTKTMTSFPISCIFIFWVTWQRETMGTRWEIDAKWWNINIISTKIGRYMWIWIANKFAKKFHAKRLNQSENIPKKFRGGLLFLKHPVDLC